MSKTVPVTCGDAMFWAFDVALAVLFIEAAGFGAQRPANLSPAWWPELEQELRAHALAGSSFAVQLDGFGPERRQVLFDSCDQNGCLVADGQLVESAAGARRARRDHPRLDGACS
ncbi:hypothetical protein [Streptomyces sp. NPDC002666]